MTLIMKIEMDVEKEEKAKVRVKKNIISILSFHFDMRIIKWSYSHDI